MASKYALLLGNNEYKHSQKLPALNTPVQDVNGLQDVLQDIQIGEFTNITKRFNATSDDARRLIDRLFFNKTPDDLLVLYFSGHGVKDRSGKLYLAFSDTEDDSLYSTAVSANWIKELMESSLSKKIVLILDCCYSGAFDKGAKSIVGEKVGAGSYFESQGTGIFVLAASDSFQMSWEGNKILDNLDKSLFTHYLVEGLKSGFADKNDKGWISIDDLFEYAYTKIEPLTSNQTPQMWGYKKAGNIAIAKNKNHTLIPLPEELIDALNSKSELILLGAIHKLGIILQDNNTGLKFTAQEHLKKLSVHENKIISEYAITQISSYRDTFKTRLPYDSEKHTININNRKNLLKGYISLQKLILNFSINILPHIIILLSTFGIAIIIDWLTVLFAKFIHSSNNFYSILDRLSYSTYSMLAFFIIFCWPLLYVIPIRFLEREFYPSSTYPEDERQLKKIKNLFNFILYWISVKLVAVMIILYLRNSDDTSIGNMTTITSDDAFGLACVLVLVIFIIISFIYCIKEGRSIAAFRSAKATLRYK